jgi:Tfp pilus assembly protein PilF
MVNAGQAAKAQPLLERTLREHPGHAGPAYGLARVRGEAGAHEEALKLYEQAASSKGADTWPLPYRIGIEQQALGRKDAAKASFARYIAAGKGQKASLEDAAKRLEQLGG